MKRFIAIFLIVFFVGFAGCTKQVKNTTLTAYEMGGVTLEEAHTLAAKMCDAKQISAKNCNQMVKTYQKAQASFNLAGDALILAGRATDSVTQKQYTDLYTKHLTDAIALANEIKNLVGMK